MAPSLTGRGWGWVGFFAAEAVSRFPGPPLEDPPTSPPHWLTGAPWGERGGTTGARAALPHAVGAASRPMCQLAWRSGRSAADRTITSGGGSAADVPPSAATGAAVEPLRALHCTRSSAARLRAWRVTGVAIWPAPHRAERSAATCKPVSSPSGASFTRSVKETGPAVPGHGKGPPRASAGNAGLAVFASGTAARQGRDAGTPVARRAAQRPGPAQRGDAQAHTDLASAPTPTPDKAPIAASPRSTSLASSVVHFLAKSCTLQRITSPERATPLPDSRPISRRTRT